MGLWVAPRAQCRVLGGLAAGFIPSGCPRLAAAGAGAGARAGSGINQTVGRATSGGGQ
jgi:hypothetical protein